ncbi:MAG: hypothetical protein AB7I35_01465 [Ramlibacter sp.]
MNTPRPTALALMRRLATRLHARIRSAIKRRDIARQIATLRRHADHSVSRRPRLRAPSRLR